MGATMATELSGLPSRRARIEVVVVKRTDKEIKGFVVLPKRWITERTLGRMQITFIAMLLRRLAYDGS